MKNILLLSAVIAHFVYGLVFSLILLYASPNEIVYSFESSLYSIGSAFFVLTAISSVSFEKEKNNFTKILFVSYALYIISCYSVMALIYVYAPPDGHANYKAFTINIAAIAMVILGIILMYLKPKERVADAKCMHVLVAIVAMLTGVFLGINAAFGSGTILEGSYYFLIASLATFLLILFYPVGTKYASKWFYYGATFLFSSFSFIMALVALYGAPNNLVNPLASVLFFIASMVVVSSLLLDYKYLDIFKNLNDGKGMMFLKILFAVLPVVMIVKNAYERV